MEKTQIAMLKTPNESPKMTEDWTDVRQEDSPLYKLLFQCLNFVPPQQESVTVFCKNRVENSLNIRPGGFPFNNLQHRSRQKRQVDQQGNYLSKEYYLQKQAARKSSGRSTTDLYFQNVKLIQELRPFCRWVQL